MHVMICKKKNNAKSYTRRTLLLFAFSIIKIRVLKKNHAVGTDNTKKKSILSYWSCLYYVYYNIP